MKTAFMTDQGKVRQHNEDNGGVFVNKDGDYFAVVADGMGGHRAGDVASAMTITNLKAFWEETSGISSPDIAEKWLYEHILKINELLFHHSNDHSECNGMGTTFVGAICTRKFSTIAHIGDSRCYLLNANGFSQMTEDHSLVNELVRSGQITREDAEHHPRKNVLLRALGTDQQIEVDIKTIILEDEDTLILCSDGLSNKVTENEMQEILKSDQTFEEMVNMFIQLANERGGEDNITLAIVQFMSTSESG